MMSAGGEEAASGVTVPGVGVSGVSTVAMDKFLGSTTLNDILTKQENMFGYGLIANGVNQLFSMVTGIWTTSIMADASTEINDRRMLAQETISGNQTEVSLKYLEVTDSANGRMYGPNGAARELAQIGANKEVAIHGQKMEAAKDIAAMQSVDSVFGYSKNEYDYGNPFANA